MPNDEGKWRISYFDRVRFRQQLEDRQRQRAEEKTQKLEEIERLVGRKVEKDGVVYTIYEIFPLPDVQSELVGSEGEPAVVFADEKDEHFWGPIPIDASVEDIIATLEGNGYTFLD